MASPSRARFCAQCGAPTTSGARFCAQCGVALDGRGVPAAPADDTGWRLTTGGLGVFGLLLVSGLAIWTVILSPSPPKPRPGAGPGGPAPEPEGGQAAQALPPEIPAEVKSFIVDLEKRAQAAPQDKALWIRLAKVYGRTAQVDPSYQPKALAAFDHVLGIDPDDREAIRGKASVFYDRNDHAQAIPLLERYLTLVGDDPSARTDLATMYLASGDGPKAVATYQAVIEKHPDFLEAHYNLAVSHAQLGDVDAAIAGFTKARSLATDDRARRQIDSMIAHLKGEAPPPMADAGMGGMGGGEPGGAPAPPVAPAASTASSPFQRDVETRLRATPIMGERIVRIDWPGAGQARVVVQAFPMDGMPEAVRSKFTERLVQLVREAAQANAPGGDVKIEIADAGAGRVMATVTP